MFKHTALAVIAAAALSSACATNPARASTAVPLNVPEPPPREPVTPVPMASAPVPVTATPPPEATPTALAGRATQPPPAAAPAPVVASAPVSTTPPAPTPPVSPPPDLRPAGPGALTPTAPRVIESLARITKKLDAIDRRKLSAGKSADYDSARRFLAQAADAVKANNLLLAQSTAEKAEALADGLR